LSRILVIAPNWIGDALMAQPLLTRLKQSGAALDVLAPEWVAPVMQRMPEVDEVIPAPFRHGPLQLRERWRLGRSLRRRGYDSAIVLPNTWKSALVPFLAGIPKRVGYVGELRYGLLNELHKAAQASMPLHYARLAGGSPAELAHPRLEVSSQEIQDAKRRFGVGRLHRVLPGREYGPAKRWPHFREPAEKIGALVVLSARGTTQPAAAGIGGKNSSGRRASTTRSG
jgi:heptosyltransferase-2